MSSAQPSPEEQVTIFLTRYVEAAGLDLQLHRIPSDPSDTTSPALAFEFLGSDVALLLDRNAELLNALEHLAAKLLGLNPEEHHRLRLDAAGHKAGRDRELHLLAQQAVDEVNSHGHPFRLAPMNSRERRLVHLLIAAAGLRSTSTGEGAFRSVTVQPNQPAATPRPSVSQPPTPRPATSKPAASASQDPEDDAQNFNRQTHAGNTNASTPTEDPAARLARLRKSFGRR